MNDFIVIPVSVWAATAVDRDRNRRPVGSVGKVPDYRAGGRGFKARPDQHSGSLNNREESAAFVMVFANG